MSWTHNGYDNFFEFQFLIATRAIKMHSAQESDDPSNMHCSPIGMRVQHGFSIECAVRWLCCAISAAASSVPRTLTTHLRDTRCESEGPIWPYVCPLCETFLGPGPWFQPPISATEGTQSGARVLKLWPRKKERDLKAFHPFQWQWVKENSLEIFVREGAVEVTVTWRVYG